MSKHSSHVHSATDNTSEDESIVIFKIRSNLKIRLTTPSETFRGHEKEWSQIHDLVLRTVTMGESNSVLIVGPRGCGKTTVSNLHLATGQ